MLSIWLEISKGEALMNAKVGLVLSGGGAKGAYQVGVMRYLAEVEMEVHAVSGASIGALNGAVIAGSSNSRDAYLKLHELWMELAKEPPLKINGIYVGSYLAYSILMGASRLSPVSVLVLKMLRKQGSKVAGIDDFGLIKESPIRKLIDKYTSYETLSKGLPLYVSAYKTEGTFSDIKGTVLGILGLSDTKESDFFHVQSFSEDKQQDVIFASAALPLLFEPQEIESEHYSDGGLGGWKKSQGNTPITPLIEECGCSHIIVTHLTDASAWNRYDFPNTTIIEIRPKIPISKESQVKDLLNFKASKINELIEQGYEDAKRCIGDVKVAVDLQAKSQQAISRRDDALAILDDDFNI